MSTPTGREVESLRDSLQGVAHDERRRPRQRAALPAGAAGLTVRRFFSPERYGRRRTLAAEVARSLEVSPATLRRWVADGIVPLRDGGWTPAAIAHARIVARLRARGHCAGRSSARRREDGRLAYGYIEDLFPARRARRSRSRRRRARPGSSRS